MSNTKPTARTKPKCGKGTACGFTCISGKYVCSSKILKRDADALVNSVTKAEVIADPPGIEPWEEVQVLGQGEFGWAVLTDRGTVVKYIKDEADIGSDDPVAESRREYDMMVVMDDLGIGPKALGFDSKTGDIEMSRVDGETFEIGYKYALSDTAKSTLITNAYESITKLHKAGYSHNDFHSGNALFDKDLNVTIIDAGMAGKPGEPYSKYQPYRSGFHDITMFSKYFGALASTYIKPLNDKLEASGVLDKYKEMRDTAHRSPTDPSQDADLATVVKQRGDAEKYLHTEYLKLI